MAGNVVRCRFDACWASSNTQYGVYIDTSGSGTVDGITFIDLNAYLNGQDGLHCNGGNITIDGGIFANNKGSGISLASGSDRVYMSGVKSGAFSGLAGNKYGLFVDAGCTRIDILDSRFDSNTTSNVINGSTNSPSLRVARNAGYRTFAKGQATMPAGSTNVVVNHGLAMAPSSAEVMLSMASNLGNATRFWVSEATATSFTISVNSDPSLTLYFNWEINLEARGG